MIASGKKALFIPALLVLALAALAGFLAPSGAEARLSYYRCRVIAAGPSGDGQTGIMLRGLSPEFSDKWFLADPLRAREQLAVALAAIVNGKEVFVQVDLELVGKPPVNAILLIN
jgi:hypothetical protein